MEPEHPSGGDNYKGSGSNILENVEKTPPENQS